MKMEELVRGILPASIGDYTQTRMKLDFQSM